MQARRLGGVLAVLAVAVLTAALLAVPATAAKGPARATVRVTVTDLDSRGVPLGPPRAAVSGERALLASGCRQVDVYYESKSFLFRATVYKWHHTKRWCWSSGKLTTVVTSAYATNVDPNWYYRGLAASTGYFYNGNAAHYSFRQAKMENCILKFGCIGSEYPWVKIWAFANGSYSYAKGT